MIPDPLPFERSFLRWLELEGIEAERETVQLEDESAGQCVAYRFTPPSPVRRVVAVHGAGNDALFAWIGFFKRQLTQGTEIVTFDLPGHGRLSDALWDEGSLQEWIGTAIRKAMGDDADLPTHLVGVSLGGSVVLTSLAGLVGPIASAVAIVAPRRIRFSLGAVLSEFRPRIAATLVRGWSDYGLTGLLPSFGPFKRHVYPLRLASLGEGPFGYVDVLNRSLDRLFDDAALETVSMPVLLVYGGLDRIVPRSQGEAIARALPNGRLFVAPRGTHLTTPLLPMTGQVVDSWLTKNR